MQRNFVFAQGEYYHIYNRGVEKRDIFLEQSDYERFVRLLYVANGTQPFIFREIADQSFSEIERGDQLVAIGAWCIMPNHFHILVKAFSDEGISVFVKKLCTGYATYFNKKHKHTGVVFENVFKAKHANQDEYLKYLYAYIHLNPVKLIKPDWKEAGITDLRKTENYLDQYEYSSLKEYRGARREERRILSTEEFPDYFDKQFDFEEFFHDWLTHRDLEDT